MAKVSVTKTIQAPSAEVWAMVSEWGGTHKWIPGVGPVTVEGEGVGSLRSAELDPATGFPGRVTERLEVFEESRMYFCYRMMGECPLPVEHYVAEMKVVQKGASTSTVTWSSTWEPVGRSEQEIREMLDGLYRLSLDNVSRALT